ncbi:MAG: SecDF P1 head subdomain-containing protein [Microthrixaceae bacterium]
MVLCITIGAAVFVGACGSDDAAQPPSTPTTSAAEDTSWFEVAPVELPDAPCTSETTPSLDGANCYVLADAVFDAAGVEEATASQDEGRCEIPPGESICIVDGSAPTTMPAAETWSVQFALNEDALRSFNRLAGECFQRGPTCPTGQVAIVVDGKVVTAPTIQQPEYARDAFSVSGDFDRDTAEDIAHRLAG